MILPICPRGYNYTPWCPELSATIEAGGDVDYPPLSALNDLAFCPRRCALHRLDGVWVETAHTLHGTQLHDRVHSRGKKKRGDSTELRSLRLISHQLRLQGVADLVEFIGEGSTSVPFPVEYKRGKSKAWDNDDIQLCAQAICLEEMLGAEIPEGAVYHLRSHQRRAVLFSPTLRAETALCAERLHQLLAAKTLPAPIPLPHCAKCSLKKVCMPRLHPESVRYKRLSLEMFRVEKD